MFRMPRSTGECSATAGVELRLWALTDRGENAASGDQCPGLSC